MATQVTVITGEGSTSYSVSTGARGPQGVAGAAGAPGTTDYTLLTNVPSEFPPEAHTHSVSDIVSVSSNRLLGRHAGGSGAGQEVTVGNGLEFSGSGIRIADDGVTNARLANVATATIKGRIEAGDGNPEDLTAAQAKTLLSITAADITDSTAAGRAILTAADAPAQIAALGAETPAGAATQITTEFNQRDQTRFIAFIGDSITEQSDSFSGNYLRMNASGFIHWVNFHLKGRTRSLLRRKSSSLSHFGVSGATINAIRNTTAGNFAARAVEAVTGSNSQLSALLHRARDRNPIVVDLSGANDVIDVSSYTIAQVAAKRKALWDEMILGGILAENIVAIAILPHSNSTITTFADAVNTINQADAATLGITWVPYPAAFKSAGAPVASYYRDNIHPNKVGALLLGQAVANAIEPLLPDAPYTIPHSSDGPWLTGNPYMTGTQAVSGSGYSGNIATTWAINTITDATNATTTFSKVTDTEGEWQRIVVTGSNRSNGKGLKLDFPTSVFYAGMKFRIVMRAKGSGFSNFTLNVIQNSSATGIIGQDVDLIAANPLDFPAFDGVFISPVMVVTGGAKIQELWFGTAGQGTINIRQVGLIRCDDEAEPTFTDQGATTSSMVLTGSPPSFSGLVECNATSGAFTVNLPSIASANGRIYTFIKVDASANAVTLDGSGSETINGATTYSLPSQWSRVTIQAGASQWFVTGT